MKFSSYKSGELPGSSLVILTHKHWPQSYKPTSLCEASYYNMYLASAYSSVCKQMESDDKSVKH